MLPNTDITFTPDQEFNMDTTFHIQALFDKFIASGGEPKVTAFKKHLDMLIKTDLKSSFSRSGKTAEGNDWRREQKAMFAGRGAKWVQVALDVVMPRLDEFAEDGIDVTAYKSWIEQAGYAWVRYSGPRVDGSIRYAAFEVRTEASTKDHPKQLLLLPEVGLSDVISPLDGTPHSKKLEVIATPVATQPDAEEADPEPIEAEEEEVIELSAYETEGDDEGMPSDFGMSDDELAKIPETDDVEAWNEYLASQGLVDEELEDINDDIF